MKQGSLHLPWANREMDISDKTHMQNFSSDVHFSNEHIVAKSWYMYDVCNLSRLNDMSSLKVTITINCY